MSSEPARPLSNVEQFLARAITRGLALGLHTPAEFVARFPPDAIMEFLKHEPDKRARILIRGLAVKEKTARALAAEHAGALLQTAFASGEVTDGAIVAEMPAEDSARHFPHVALWAFITNGDWWRKPSPERLPRAQQYMAALLDDLRACDLLSTDVLLQQLTISKLARTLPRDLLEKLFEAAAEKGRGNAALQSAHVFSIVRSSHLSECLDLDYIFQQVLVPFAQRQRLVLKRSDVVEESAALAAPGGVASTGPAGASAEGVRVAQATLARGSRTKTLSHSSPSLVVGDDEQGDAAPPQGVDASWTK